MRRFLHLAGGAAKYLTIVSTTTFRGRRSLRESPAGRCSTHCKCNSISGPCLAMFPPHGRQCGQEPGNSPRVLRRFLHWEAGIAMKLTTVSTTNFRGRRRCAESPASRCSTHCKCNSTWGPRALRPFLHLAGSAARYSTSTRKQSARHIFEVDGDSSRAM